MSWEIMPSLQLAGYMDGATAAERDISGALDVRAEVEYKVTPRAKLTSWVSAGLTNGAPAFAIMSEFSYRFWTP